MAIALPEGDIFGAAVELVTSYGFVGAKAKARAMASEFAESGEVDAGDGVIVWEGIGAVITMLHARLM